METYKTKYKLYLSFIYKLYKFAFQTLKSNKHTKPNNQKINKIIKNIIIY